MCSAWRIRRDNDIGTFGEKRRKLEVVQTGGVSVWICISTCCTAARNHHFIEPHKRLQPPCVTMGSHYLPAIGDRLCFNEHPKILYKKVTRQQIYGMPTGSVIV